MIDREGRWIDYLRISITDRCNLRCQYCMPECGVENMPHDQILQYDEILRIAGVMARELGLAKIKVTGGEPLVRRDCPELIRQLKALPGIQNVTLTTNGVELARQMPQLAQAGVDAINISLDTLDAEEFAHITRRDMLPQVLEGIRAAQAFPQVLLKLNVVPIAEQDETLLELAALAREYPIHVRFIEMMPIGFGRKYRSRSEAELVELLGQRFGPLTPVEGNYGNGPGHYYAVPGFQGRVGFISAISHKFCDSCNRVRLTADGYLKTCLQYESGRDLREMLRTGCTDAQLCAAIREAILAKPACHHFTEVNCPDAEHRAMSQIGG